MIEIPSQYIFFLIGLNLIALFSLILWLFFINKKMNKMLMHGSENLGESSVEAKKQIAELRKFEKEITDYLKIAEKRLSRSLQSVETIRFNPFKGIGSGGNQSFSTSFVNEKGDGIVVSGLYYSQDRVSIFSKPLKDWKSDHELTDEEKEAIERSKKSLKL